MILGFVSGSFAGTEGDVQAQTACDAGGPALVAQRHSAGERLPNGLDRPVVQGPVDFRQPVARPLHRAKDDRRGDYDRLIREVVRRIQAHESVTDAQRAALGITVRDGEPTPAPAPTTRPVVTVDFSKRMQHTLRYADESTPTRRPRPRGVIGAEVWVKVAAPADPPLACLMIPYTVGRPSPVRWVAVFVGFLLDFLRR